MLQKVYIMYLFVDDSSDAFSDVSAEMHHTKYSFHKSKTVGLAK